MRSILSYGETTKPLIGLHDKIHNFLAIGNGGGG